MPVAKAKGIRVVFHVFPISPTALSSSPDSAERFAEFLAKLATAYPGVRDFVVGNEPNQPRFLRPQFSRTGRGLAAAAYAGLLAKSYDALKESRPGDPRDRSWPFGARQRSTVGAVERLHLAGPLPT